MAPLAASSDLSRDGLLVGGWVFTSAALFTVHVFILARLVAGGSRGLPDGESKRRTRIITLLSVFVPVLVPWAALRSSQRLSALLWVVFAALYGAVWLGSLGSPP